MVRQKCSGIRRSYLGRTYRELFGRRLALQIPFGDRALCRNPYGSDDWQRFCRANNLAPSMSRRGNCRDNAVAESFFSSWSGSDRQAIEIPNHGRQLNQHPHIHLSVTRGGLCRKYGVWRPIFFKKKVVERYWRQAVTALLRQHYTSLNLPGTGYRHIRDYREWCQFLESQYQRRWKIHFAKKTKHVRQNVNYLGRYLKRPPVAVAARV